MCKYGKQERECWFAEFKTPKQYADAKIKMLREDMFIKPTKKEIEHLYSLKTQHDIDRSIASIVDKHWSQCGGFADLVSSGEIW